MQAIQKTTSSLRAREARKTMLLNQAVVQRVYEERKAPVIPKPRVVVLDDDKTYAELISKTLQNGGYDVIGACHAPDMMEILASLASADLIILDMVMPLLDGKKVFSLVRKMPNLHDTPVIFLTGSITVSEQETLNRHYADSAVMFLAKPVSAQELLQKAKQMILETARSQPVIHNDSPAQWCARPEA